MTTSPNRLPLTLSLFIIVFPLLSEAFYSPMLMDLTQYFNLTPFWTELTLVAFYIGLALGTLFWHRLIPHLGQRFCLLAGFLLYGPGAIFGLTAECGWAIFGARLMQGFGISIGLWIVPTLSFQRKGVSQENLMGISALLVLIMAPLLGFFLGGYCGEAFGFRSYFFVLGIFSLILLAYSFLGFPREGIDDEWVAAENIILSVRKVIKQRDCLLSMLVLSLIGMLFLGYCGGAPWILIQGVGLSPSQYGSLGLFIVLPCLAAGVVSLQFLKSFSREKVIWMASWITLIGAVMLQGMLMLPLENNVLAATLYWVIATSVIWFGSGLAFMPSLHIAMGKDRVVMAEKIPLVGLFLWTFASVGGVVLGLAADVTLKCIPFFILAVSGILVVISYGLRNQNSQSTSKEHKIV